MRLTKARLFTLIFIGLFLATTTAAVCCYAVAATSVDDSSISHYKQSGPGYDIYLPKSSNVNFEELIFVVNYGDEPLILNITGTIYGQDRQYAYRSIEPRSSEWVKVTFLDVGAAYQLYLGRPSQPLMILPLTRSVEEYVPPQGGGWVYVPPSEQGPAVYTQEEWDDMIGSFWALIAQLTLEMIVIISMVMAGGFAMGAGVKNWTRFIAPSDPISIGLIAIAVADMVLSWTPIGLYWIPVLGGYLLAFFVWHIDYIGKATLDIPNRSLKVSPVVIYHPDESDQAAIQRQTWGGLWSRLRGAHHWLGTDAPLAEVWTYALKKPYWPLMKAKGLWVEKEVVESKDVPRGKGKTRRESLSRWILADGSTKNKIDLMVDAELLEEYHEERRKDKMDITRLRAEREIGAIRSASLLIREMQDASSTEIMEQYIRPRGVELPKVAEELSAEQRLETEPKDEEETQ